MSLVYLKENRTLFFFLVQPDFLAFEPMSKVNGVTITPKSVALA